MPHVECLEGRALLSASPLTFDFGSPTSPVHPGTIGVSREAYTPSRGYGWADTTNLDTVDRGIAPGYVQVDPAWFRTELGDLSRDFVMGWHQSHAFLVDLPNGSYQVTVAIGDYSAPHDMIAIRAEGELVASGISVTNGQFALPSFRVDVADGRLDLTISDEGGTNPFWVLNALEIRPADAPSSLTVEASAPARAPENSAVTLAATATGGAALLGYTYAWDLDGDGTFEATGRQVTHTFADDGAYRVAVRVTDGLGQEAYGTRTIQVDNLAPSVSAVVPGKVTIGQSNRFLAEATDASPVDVAAGVAFAWDFGDGTTGTGANPDHAYTRPGTYTVTVTATDKDGGRGKAQVEVEVGLPPGYVHEHVPHYGMAPTIVSAGSGPWSDPSTWVQGRVPGPGDEVAIAEGTEVVYDLSGSPSLDVVVVHAGGQLRFRNDINTELLVGTLMVMPGGVLEVGTEARPVAPGVKATITIADKPIDTNFDPEQFGTGLIALGSVTIHGAPLNTTFVRLAAEPMAGAAVLVLEQPVSGWRVGDRLFLPDSRQLNPIGANNNVGGDRYSPEYEEPTIQAISPDGKTITLSEPLRFDHPGARDGDGRLEFLPHVANLTRNVVIRSEDPAGTRGHTIFHGRADVDIRYAQFLSLGRTTNDPLDNTTFDSSGAVTRVGTNQIGRYPLHVHHLLGPERIVGPESPPSDGHQFALVGNSIDSMEPIHNFKWGLAIHASHYGLVRDNVVHNWAGAGLVTEDGSESYNVIEHNFVGRIHGIGGRGENNHGGWGRQGDGIWLRGQNNYVRDNVVANVFGTTNGQSYGYSIIPADVQDVYLPNGPGEYPSAKVNIHDLPIREFARNEFYGTASTALTFWYIGSYDGMGNRLSDVIPESVVKDFRAWHFYDQGVYVYPSKNVTLDGYVARGDQKLLAAGLSNTKGYFAGDYKNVGMTIRNADIQGLRTGITFPTLSDGVDMTVNDSYLRNYTNIAVETVFGQGDPANIPARRILIRDVLFAAPAMKQVGAEPMLDIDMRYLDGGNRHLVQRDEVYVYNYNRARGDNFRVYYREQAPDFIVPMTTPSTGWRIIGAPESGLTNREAWLKYQVAIAGAVAPPTATMRAKVRGLVDPL